MFIQNNQEFDCIVCNTHVKAHPTSSRNHCTNCLTSVHVDIFPGDRKNPCRGIMHPIGLEMKDGRTQIVYECETCKKKGKNIVAPDDNNDLIVALSTKQYTL